jgi:hypothetical protein
MMPDYSFYPQNRVAISISFKLSGDKWRRALVAASGFESPTKGLGLSCFVAVE